VLPAEPEALTLSCDGACVTLDGNAHTAAVARVLSVGWSRAQAGLAEILRFGAALLAVKEWIEAQNGTTISTRERGADGRFSGTSGVHLQGWLEKHCPDINYKTAYGYMQAAEGLRNVLKLADDVPLLPLMGMDPIPDAAREKLRAKTLKIIGESTLTLLKAAVREAPRGGDRRSGIRLSEEEKHLRAVDDAREAWKAGVARLVVYARDMRTHLLLDAAALDVLLLGIETVRDALREARGK
jgi:hypothetical protein